MAIYLRLLRFFISVSSIPRESALWYYKIVSRDKDRILRGLGFINSIETYRFSWLNDKIIDWVKLRTTMKVSRELIFGTRNLLRKYYRYYKRTNAIVNTT